MNWSEKFCYSPTNSIEVAISELLRSITLFNQKRNFQWHIEFQVETKFNFLDLNNIKEELDLQEEIENAISFFIKMFFSFTKVVSYYQDRHYYYHLYIESNILDFKKFDEGLKIIADHNQRKIKFELTKDTDWKNVMNSIVKDYDSILGWASYMCPSEK